MNAQGCSPLARRRSKGETMPRRRLLYGAVTSVLLVLAPLFIFGCGSAKKQQSRAADEAASGSVNVVPIEVAAVEQRPFSVTKTYSGTLEGEEQANIVAKIPERITGIKAHVGEAVRSGQVILTLDKSGTSSQYYQASAAFKNAEKTLERMKSLYGEGAISLQALDETQTAYDVAKANFDAARGAVELTTPLAGIVTAINASTGDLADPGAVLATIANVNKMKVTFDISETEVPNVTMGQKIQVHSDMRPDVQMDGRVIQLSKSADVRSRSFGIKAIFPNTSDKWFKPGMFCKVDVPMSSRGNVLVVPSAAVQSDGVTSRVFVVRNGRALERSVKAGVAAVDYTQVLSGVSVGDTVATIGINNLTDSTLVSVTRESRGAAAAQ